MVTIADCERVQTAWFRARAGLSHGEVWTDGPLLWIDGPDGQNLMFPTELPLAGLRRGLVRAREHGLAIVGAWLNRAVDPTPLAEAGFERGWPPWWMTADLSTFDTRPDPRIELGLDSTGWCARAYTAGTRQLAGGAWSFVDGELAGIFDLEVWPSFQRRGLGTGLLNAVCVAARTAGARHAVLNATPQGKLLYRARGFRQLGEGITWWHHLRPTH